MYLFRSILNLKKKIDSIFYIYFLKYKNFFLGLIPYLITPLAHIETVTFIYVLYITIDFFLIERRYSNMLAIY